MTKLLCTCAFFAAFLITSCSKNNDIVSDGSNSFIDPPGTTGAGTTSAPRLTKFYALDTTRAAPYDTVSRYYFNYDALNRIDKFTEFTIKPNGDSLSYSVKKFLYNGTDTFAYFYSTLQRSFQGSGIVTGIDSMDFIYSGGRMVYDSVRLSPISYNRLNLSYSGANVLGTYRLQGVYWGYATGTYKYHPVKVNGNIVSQKDTTARIFSTSPGTTIYNGFNRTVSYNANPNPLAKYTAINKREYLNSIGLYAAASPVNLIVNENIAVYNWANTGPSTLVRTDHSDYTYEFRADGYPKIAREHIINDGNETYSKLLFFYNN